MSLRVVTPQVNTNIPGTYVSYNVLNSPVGAASSGIVVIFGEADGGDSYQNVKLADNFFTPDQLDKIKQKYISGQIVDAFRALSAPSADAGITGTASLVYVAKTNQGSKASAILDTNYGTLSDLNFGIPGNSYKYQVVSTNAESGPSISGNTIAAFGAPLNGLTFDIRVNGGASSTVTLSGTAANHQDVPTLVVELNGLLPAGIVADAGSAPNTIKLSASVDALAYRKGYGKSFELVDPSVDLAAIGLSAGLVVSSQEPSIEMQLNNVVNGLNENLDASADIALKVGYQGTTATLSISGGVLSTSVVGGSGSGLSIQLSQFSTIGNLASFIALQPGYSAAAMPAASQLPPSALDQVSSIGICSTTASLEAGRIKMAMYNFKKALGISHGVSFAATASAGLPSPMASAALLSGGARGHTLAADVANVVASLKGINCNIVLPLFSQDASADIIAGQTDSLSTYTISSVHALVKSHCLQYSSALLGKNRFAILSYNGLFANAKAIAQGLASYRCTLAFQPVNQVDSAGNTVLFQPWYAACVAAGMQAGGFYKCLTNKYANVISYVDPADFDSGDPGDVSAGLDAGLLFLMKDVAGNKWVSDQTTYGFDTNFVYNSLQAVYAADLIAIDLKQSFTQAFVGQSLADVSAASASAFLTQKMSQYMQLKLIGPSNDAPLGFKNAKVSINAPTMSVSVEIKLATAIYFVTIDFSISAIQQSA